MRVSQPPSFFPNIPAPKVTLQQWPGPAIQTGSMTRQIRTAMPSARGQSVCSSLFRLFFFLLLHFAACASLSRSLSSNNRQSDQPRSQGPSSQVDPFCVLFFSQDASAQPARAAPCHSAVCSLQSLGMPSSGRQSTRTPAGQIPRSQAEGELLHRAHRWRQPGHDRERKHHHRRTDRHVVAHSNA